MSATTAARITLHGRVQGVFYRNWTVDTARELCLAGWVRNETDGTVTAHLEGDTETIGTMIDRMREGPPRARVDRVDRDTVPAAGFSTFERR